MFLLFTIYCLIYNTYFFLFFHLNIFSVQIRYEKFHKSGFFFQLTRSLIFIISKSAKCLLWQCEPLLYIKKSLFLNSFTNYRFNQCWSNLANSLIVFL